MAARHVRCSGDVADPAALFPGGIVLTCTSCQTTTPLDAPARWVQLEAPAARRNG